MGGFERGWGRRNGWMKNGMGYGVGGGWRDECIAGLVVNGGGREGRIGEWKQTTTSLPLIHIHSFLDSIYFSSIIILCCTYNFSTRFRLA